MMFSLFLFLKREHNLLVLLLFCLFVFSLGFISLCHFNSISTHHACLLCPPSAHGSEYEFKFGLTRVTANIARNNFCLDMRQVIAHLSVVLASSLLGIFSTVRIAEENQNCVRCGMVMSCSPDICRLC